MRPVPYALSLALIGACGLPTIEPATLDDAPLPAAADNTPDDNATTPDGAALGRALFYDTQLSASGNVSCGSCHQQDFAFSDPAARSEGHLGGLTRRNSMPLVNVGYYRSGRMFWDERAGSLEEQVLMPIFDDVEMGLDEEALVARVAQDPGYAPLFGAAFGDEAVTTERISRALAQFVRSIVSFRSRFDEAVLAAGTLDGPLPGFTQEENRGKDLFFSGRTRCARCHVRGPGPQAGDGPRPGNGGPPPGNGNGVLGDLAATLLGGEGLMGQPLPAGELPVFFVNGARHNGLSIDNDDLGLFEVTGDDDDIGRFKSPSLRNVALTGPYMHDGRFDTLEAVIAHYDRGVVDHENLDDRLRRDGQPIRMNLDQDERAALVAFLHTLTDDALLSDPDLSDPFAN